MAPLSLSAVHLATADLPGVAWRALAAEAASRDRVTARRTLLLVLLWQENYQVQATLVSRVRYQLGLHCFGANCALTFRRDMQAIKSIFAASGLELKYSRRAEKPGYYIPGRPDLAPEVERAIRGAVEEVDTRQMAAWSRMTPGQRVGLATNLSDEVLSIAVHRQMKARPDLNRLGAQREVLHRYYQPSR